MVLINNLEFTFLSKEQVSGDNQLDILKNYGTTCEHTDFSLLLGGREKKNSIIGSWWTKTVSEKPSTVNIVAPDGNIIDRPILGRCHCARPAIPYSLISLIALNKVKYKSGVLEVEFGEYPQTIVNEELEKKLEELCKKSILKKTGKCYTTDSVPFNDFAIKFIPEQYKEYEYNGKKYIRIICGCNGEGKELSDGRVAERAKPYWIAVEPITWLVDEKTDIALSKKLLFSGVQFHSEDYNGDFNKTDIKKFMDKYFSKEIVPNVVLEKEEQNQYEFDYGQVSEDEIIKGAVESNVAVFIHGLSGDGKSSRVKQLDPDCEIIYMRNATPDSLNGKSVYNSQTGEMIDVAPSWYKRFKGKCEKEPDKIHILFFDELTNALPSVQGMAFNIILDGEVNGIWKLPKNARIVAAGNDVKDSLAANKMAEPLFNRFAHVYIKTKVEDWLKWADTPKKAYQTLEYKEEKEDEQTIHPAIITYINYRGEEALRSEYNGETPNANPRKWEMASKILYKTNKPEMLRALVGEELTQEFIEFCKQQMITIDDALSGNYNIARIRIMDSAKKYITVVGLSKVDEEHLEQVREVVKEMGEECLTLFEQLWTHGDKRREEKLEKIHKKENDEIIFSTFRKGKD